MRISEIQQMPTCINVTSRYINWVSGILKMRILDWLFCKNKVNNYDYEMLIKKNKHLKVVLDLMVTEFGWQAVEKNELYAVSLAESVLRESSAG